MTTLISQIASRRALAGIAAAIVLLSSGTFTAAAGATPDGDVPSVVVRFGDLDLSTQEGALVLYRRIVSAAERVCPAWNPRDLQTVSVSSACRKAAIARAVAAVPSERLAAIHAAHDKRA